MTTNADITIFNARYDPKGRTEVLIPTEIRRVSLLESEASSVIKGVWTEKSVFKIRIPLQGSVIQDGRSYVPEEVYKDLKDVTDVWTIRKADIIVLGSYRGGKSSLARTEVAEWAHQSRVKMIQVTEYSDNTVRGCDAVRHWRIGGA